MQLLNYLHYVGFLLVTSREKVHKGEWLGSLFRVDEFHSVLGGICKSSSWINTELNS